VTEELQVIEMAADLFVDGGQAVCDGAWQAGELQHFGPLQGLAPELLTWRVRSWSVGLAFDAVDTPHGSKPSSRSRSSCWLKRC